VVAGQNDGPLASRATPGARRPGSGAVLNGENMGRMMLIDAD